MTRVYVEMTRLGDLESRYIEARCLHDEHVVPVESCIDGEVLAQLCTDCDTQLPPGWSTQPDAGCCVCGHSAVDHAVVFIDGVSTPACRDEHCPCARYRTTTTAPEQP